METLSTRKRKRPEKKVRYYFSRHSFSEKFDSQSSANMDLNINTKRAALKASTFVVSLVSRTGGKTLFIGSGAITECEGVNGAYISTILTSASLLRSSPELNVVPDDIKVNVYLSDGESFEGQVFACDFHYNIAAIKIKSDEALPMAILRNWDDSTSIDPTGKDKGLGSEYFQLHPHSNLFNLCPGDNVVAVGRYFRKPYDLMAASGKFRKFCRPWLGMEMTNLYAASADMLERTVRKFPNISKGVLVKEVHSLLQIVLA
ncbi:hypothetical protein Vadar_028299 [Vaccinium darrowii]|uniref:Uncharacterized protein n=1 Tax=Vaccinium darrowii TaxID=229202 RepID=A0ACB7YHR6_9ERIC|nr:hypothetical protein Vadar_028299 [Vaccinium darrowii]